ncbi:MAG TPA: SDR family NAD(P)-dependent oxidoreductase [Alphaproteobacteria bacterium]|jgi:NAD(P)-dependent dehydrogenase (short-subunit alcohol dehydrogenase family)|nr:SDR family NAD(P)-dependent oxidoreductase [Alphaproteobacteria bacterium]
MTQQEIAVVVGAGPGLGNALVHRFARAGMTVAAVSRRGGHVDSTPAADRGRVKGYVCDATQSRQVTTAFAGIERELGVPDLVVFNIGTWDRGGVLELSEDLFVRAWRIGCLAGFLVGQAAARAMLPRGSGTIIFSGATGSIRGGAGFAAFAVPKFGLRALAQSMARELGPKGLHVAHVLIDGMIAAEGESGAQSALAPAAIAESYYGLYRQDRSAWSHEIDLRPMGERF